MIYPYACIKCDAHFDVIKSYRDLDRNEFCERCGAPAERQFTARVHIIGAKVEDATWNPAFGCVDKGRAHRKELCKKFNVEEIGNEKPERVQKHFDDAREETRKKRWEKAEDE